MLKKINLYDILKIVLVGFGVISCLYLFSIPSLSSFMGNIKAKKLAEYRETKELAVALYYTFGLILLGLLVVVGFFIFSMITMPKKTLLSIIGLFISLTLFFILFYVGTKDTPQNLYLKKAVTQNDVDLSTAGLVSVGVCLVLGVLAIVVGPFIGRYRNYK